VEVVEPEDEEGGEDEGAVEGFETGGVSVVVFEGAVEAFDELFEESGLWGFVFGGGDTEDDGVLEGDMGVVGEEGGGEFVDGIGVGDDVRRD
jgi:hypothetical protein